MPHLQAYWIVCEECELTLDMFKCLIFVQGLTVPKDTEIRSHLLSKLEQDSKLTLQNNTEECQQIINLYHDTAKIEERDVLHIYSRRKQGTR